MNENNELNQSASLSDAAAAIELQAPKKSGPSKMLIGIVAVCVIAAVAVGIKLTSGQSDPKTVVEAAFTATANEQMAFAEEIYNKVPAAKPIFEGRNGALTTDFDFTIKSVEDVPYSTIASAILADAGIRGTVSCDPDNKTAALNGSVYLKDSQLIDGTLFISPEMVSGGVPSFSNTIVSVNPTTFADDYQNSVLNAISPMDSDELEFVQESISSNFDYISSMNSFSTEKMLNDLKPILKSSIANATYEYDKQNKNYVVNIPGADVKTAIMDYYRYIYFDSEIGTALEKVMTPTLEGISDMTYDEMMTETIDEIGESLPNMDAVMTLTIDKGVIKTAHVVCTPVAPASDSSSEAPDEFASEAAINNITIDCTFDKNSNTVKAIADITDETGEAMSISIDAIGKLENNVYSTDMNLALDSDTITLKMPLNFSIAADGAYICGLNMDINSFGETVNAGFNFNGTATFENDVLAISLPASSVNYSTPNDGSGKLVFDINCTSSPLIEKIAAPAEHTALLTMDEQQLAQLSNEYSVGYENLVGELYSLLMA